MSKNETIVSIAREMVAKLIDAGAWDTHSQGKMGFGSVEMDVDHIDLPRMGRPRKVPVPSEFVRSIKICLRESKLVWKSDSD